MNREFIGFPEELAHGWNADLEELIADIEEKSWAYTWLHNTSVNYFTKWNDRLSVAGIAIDIGTGTSTFATLNTCSQLFWVQLSTGVVIYIGAFLGSYLHYHRMSERIERHKFAASRYSSLYHNIQRERGIRPDQRQNAKDYITWVTNQYDSLLLSSPDIEDNILKRYFEEYKDNHKSHPIIYNYARAINNNQINDQINNKINNQPMRKEVSVNNFQNYLPRNGSITHDSLMFDDDDNKHMTQSNSDLLYYDINKNSTKEVENTTKEVENTTKEVENSTKEENTTKEVETDEKNIKRTKKHRKHRHHKSQDVGRKESKPDIKQISNMKLEIESDNSENDLENMVRDSEINNLLIVETHESGNKDERHKKDFDTETDTETSPKVQENNLKRLKKKPSTDLYGTLKHSENIQIPLRLPKNLGQSVMGTPQDYMIQTAPPRLEGTPQITSFPRSRNLGNSNFLRNINKEVDLDDPQKKKEYFNKLRTNLNDRAGNVFRNYYGEYDNNLLEWQLNRLKNQVTREEIDFNRMARENCIDPVADINSFR